MNNEQLTMDNGQLTITSPSHSRGLKVRKGQPFSCFKSQGLRLTRHVLGGSFPPKAAAAFRGFSNNEQWTIG